MIYFDKDKQAYMYKINNPLCTVTNEQWHEFCLLKLGKDYDISADGIVDLRVTPEYIVEEIIRLKREKKTENNEKLARARTSHTFTVTLQGQECVFDTTKQTQSDLNSAAISASIGQPWVWTTNNRVVLELTSEDVQAVAIAYSQAVNEDISKWSYYDELIDIAETLEQLKEIEINYEN